MAKKAKSAAPARKLEGKTVGFVGKFGYSNSDLPKYANLVTAEGGTVVEVDKTIPEYLFVGEGRGGKPPGDVAKLQKRSPGIQVFELGDFVPLLVPDGEGLIELIKNGKSNNPHQFWWGLEHMCRISGTKMDLQLADMRDLRFEEVRLQCALLNGSDLRGAHFKDTYFGDLENANFSGSSGEGLYFTNIRNCNFSKVDFKKAWFHSQSLGRVGPTVEACSFSSARLDTARFTRGVFRECDFSGADLSDSMLSESAFERVDFSKANLTRLHAQGANFDGADFTKANLTGADLRDSLLKNADFRNANLTGAVLSNADLSGANLDGADLNSAVLTNANLTGVDLSKAKNYQAPVVRTAGPKLMEFAAAAAGASAFITSAIIDLGPGEFVHLYLNFGNGTAYGRTSHHRSGNDSFDTIYVKTIEEVLLSYADRWPKAKLRLDKVEAKGSKKLRGQKLQDLAIAAWAETFGSEDISSEQLKADLVAQQADAVKERDELVRKIREEGVAEWNKLPHDQQTHIDLRGVDLSNASISKLYMPRLNLSGVNFTGSDVSDSDLWGGELKEIVFKDATLVKTRFHGATLTGANFQNANLTGASFQLAKLLKADFSGATLTDALFKGAHFDATTILPADFVPPEDMVWKGDGPHPGLKKFKAAKAGSLSFEDFLAKVNEKIELARVEKAGSMLKAEKFQLFAEVKDDSLIGIVKSQSSADLVYSCRLVSDGAFSCCTQNLRPCGGLRGSLCKHLLVLIIGLAKAGQIDSATVDNWINLSRSKKPAIDEDVMSATFLRYKGAEAGEIDWRPTETIPEDFYAM